MHVNELKMKTFMMARLWKSQRKTARASPVLLLLPRVALKVPI